MSLKFLVSTRVSLQRTILSRGARGGGPRPTRPADWRNAANAAEPAAPWGPKGRRRAAVFGPDLHGRGIGHHQLASVAGNVVVDAALQGLEEGGLAVEAAAAVRDAVGRVEQHVDDGVAAAEQRQQLPEIDSTKQPPGGRPRLQLFARPMPASGGQKEPYFYL